MDTGTSYTFKQVEASGEATRRYSAFLSEVFPETDKYSEAYLRWQYALNPTGPVVGFDAWAGDELAAHYVTLPVTYAIDGEIVEGLLSLNTATHPNHQGKGLFTEVASRTYELAANMGYRFVIGVANENSTHGFTKKLGWYLVSPLDVKVGMGNLRTAPATDYRLRAGWSADALRWRLGNPSHPYTCRGHELYADTGRFGIHAVLALDKPVAHDQLKGSRVVPLKTWIGIDKRIRLRGVFAELPRRMRPSPLNLIFKDLTGDLPLFGAEDVRFELLDFDAY